MKQKIEATLQCLIGTSFWGTGRITNLLTFQFGARQLRTNRGTLHEVGTYALHVQCAWRLVQAQHILAASGDRAYEPDDEHDQVIRSEMEPYAWSQTETRLLDQRLYSFFQQCEKTPIFVQAIQADDLGGLTLVLSDAHTLTLFPDDSLDEEYWRFFEPGKDLPMLLSLARVSKVRMTNGFEVWLQRKDIFRVTLEKYVEAETMPLHLCT